VVAVSFLNIPKKEVNLPFPVILDGKVVAENLKEAGLDEEWLKNQLSKKKIKEYKEVLYAEWQESQGLKLTKYS